MRITKGTVRPLQWVAGNWVTAPDVASSGVTPTASSGIPIPIPSVSFVDWVIEVERTIQRTGGTGFVRSFINLTNFQGSVTVATNSDAAAFFTGRVSCSGTAGLYTSRIKSSVFQTYSAGDNTQRLYLTAVVVGDNADTEYSMTGIRARLLYLPSNL